MKKERVPVSKRRRSRRRPPASVVESPGEDGQAFRYFVPPKTRRTGGGSSRSPETGGARADRSQRSLPSGVLRADPTGAYAPSRRGKVTYFEPPPKPPAFFAWSDDEILAWLAKQPTAYQETARLLAAMAEVPVVEHERRRSEPPCDACGYDGTPTKAHRWNCPSGVVKLPPPRGWKPKEKLPEDVDEDDDLPF